MKKTWNHQKELGTTKTKLKRRALRTTKTNFQPLKQNENKKLLGLPRQIQDHQDMRTHMKAFGTIKIQWRWKSIKTIKTKLKWKAFKTTMMQRRAQSKTIRPQNTKSIPWKGEQEFMVWVLQIGKLKREEFSCRARWSLETRDHWGNWWGDCP
jgi:hypothetical protein